MGDYGDLHFDDHARKARWSTDIAPVIKISYNAKAAQGAGWAGIYWQHPANNWGDRDGGYNLNGASKLMFKARGEKEAEKPFRNLKSAASRVISVIPAQPRSAL